MVLLYVFDTGALIAAERARPRVTNFLKLAGAGLARVYVPLPVIAEWWRGRTDAREEILAMTRIVDTIDVMKAAGVALGAMRGRVHASLTIDAVVMATAALLDAVVITQDPGDFERLAPQFPGVAVLSV